MKVNLVSLTPEAKTAVAALVKAADRGAVSEIGEVVLKPDTTFMVRSYAIEALSEIGGDEACVVLRAALKSSQLNFAEAEQVIDALVKLQDSKSIPQIGDLVASPDTYISFCQA